MSSLSYLRTLLVPIAIVGAISSPVLAQGRGPSTPEERTRVMKMAQDSEKDPLGIHAKEKKWFQKWTDEVPDFMFGPDETTLWCEANAKGDLGKVVFFQYLLSSSAYQIKHQIPDHRKPGAREVVAQAGVEGVLLAYEALLNKRPENRSEKMDEALALRAKGELHAFVKSLLNAKR